MIINGKEFRLSTFDTNQTILERVAADLKTIPKYLQPYSQPKDGIVYTNLLDDIKKIALDGKMDKEAFETLYDDKDLLGWYILYKVEDLKNEGLDNQTISMLLKEPIDDNAFKLIKDEYKMKVLENLTKVEKHLDIIKEFEGITAVPYTKFIEEKKIINISIQLETPTTLLAIFDNLQMKDVKVAATILENRVIYKTREPYHKEIDADDIGDLLVIYISDDVYKVGLKDNIFLTIKYDVNIKYTLDKSVIYNVLNLPLKKDKIDESKIKGSFTLDFIFQKDIFADLIMNHPMFRFLYLDERLKVSKHVNSLKVYFISEAKAKDISFNLQFTGYSTRCYITHINDKKNIPYFQDILSKLCNVYNDNYEKVLEFYTDHNVKVKQNVKLKKDHTLAEYNKDMFIHNYSRKCSKTPKIVEEKVNEPDHYTMGFLGTVYSCDHHKDYKYPGLIINKLSNASTYPFLPCCFQSDQRHRRGGPYRHYFLGEPLNMGKTDHDFYKSHRFLPPKSYGALPLSIAKVFLNLKLQRYGVTTSNSSFLECVADACGVPPPSRMTFNTEAYLALTKQETFDIPYKELENILSKDDLYLPTFFISALERHFDVSIFLFTKDGLVLPYRSKIGSYLLRPLRKHSILIYEHFEQSIVRCELITLKEVKIFESNSTLITNLNKLRIKLANNNGPLYSPIKDTNNYSSQYIDSAGKVSSLFSKDKEFKLEQPHPPYFLPPYLTSIDDDSQLNLYIRYKKLAKIFFDYILHNFVHSSVDDVAAFIKNHTIVIEGYAYGCLISVLNRTIQYSNYNSIFKDDDGKIIFSSNMLLLKIAYNIKLLKLRLGFEKMFKIWGIPFVTSFYENISDFNHKPGEIIYFNMKVQDLSIVMDTLYNFKDPVILNLNEKFYIATPSAKLPTKGTAWLFDPPKGFKSRSLTKDEEQYIIYKLEGKTVILSLQKFG